MGRIDYLGLSFDRLDASTVVSLLRERAAGAAFGYLVTPNVDHVVRLATLARDGEEWDAYDKANWCLCDSRVLAAIAARQGIDLPVFSGSDLAACLFGDIASPGDRICLIGGEVGDIRKLAAMRPDLQIVQHIPPMGLHADRAARAAAARFAAESGARFTLLAVGSPQQELIAAAITTIPDARGTALCVGASIDFLTGREKRAPHWMRRLSLEWLHRLIGNPRRFWRRYLVDGPRIFLLAWRARP